MLRIDFCLLDRVVPFCSLALDRGTDGLERVRIVQVSIRALEDEVLVL